MITRPHYLRPAIVDDMDDTSISQDNDIYERLVSVCDLDVSISPLCDIPLLLDSPIDSDIESSGMSHITQNGHTKK